MNKDKFDQGLKEMGDRNKRLSAMVLSLSVMVILCLLTIVQTIGTGKTIVVPPTIERSFWVTHDHASKEYLEQMAGYVSWLILDVTPASIDWKKKSLLEFVSPDASGELSIRQDVEGERLKKINASTDFGVRQLVVNEEQQSVLVIGQMRTQVNGESTSKIEKQYLVQFEFKSGRMHLKSFKEVSNVSK